MQILTFEYFLTTGIRFFVNKIYKVATILVDNLFDGLTNFDNILGVELILFVHLFIDFKNFLLAIKNNNIFLIIKNSINDLKRNVK